MAPEPTSPPTSIFFPDIFDPVNVASSCNDRTQLASSFPFIFRARAHTHKPKNTDTHVKPRPRPRPRIPQQSAVWSPVGPRLWTLREPMGPAEAPRTAPPHSGSNSLSLSEYVETEWYRKGRHKRLFFPPFSYTQNCLLSPPFFHLGGRGCSF